MRQHEQHRHHRWPSRRGGFALQSEHNAHRRHQHQRDDRSRLRKKHLRHLRAIAATIQLDEQHQPQRHQNHIQRETHDRERERPDDRLHDCAHTQRGTHCEHQPESSFWGKIRHNAITLGIKLVIFCEKSSSHAQFSPFFLHKKFRPPTSADGRNHIHIFIYTLIYAQTV